jgi:hypothetical protein
LPPANASFADAKYQFDDDSEVDSSLEESDSDSASGSGSDSESSGGESGSGSEGESRKKKKKRKSKEKAKRKEKVTAGTKNGKSTIKEKGKGKEKSGGKRVRKDSGDDAAREKKEAEDRDLERRRANEREWAANRERNARLLADLKLTHAASEMGLEKEKPAPKTQGARTKTTMEPAGPARRSGRLGGDAVPEDVEMTETPDAGGNEMRATDTPETVPNAAMQEEAGTTPACPTEPVMPPLPPPTTQGGTDPNSGMESAGTPALVTMTPPPERPKPQPRLRVKNAATMPSAEEPPPASTTTASPSLGVNDAPPAPSPDSASDPALTTSPGDPPRTDARVTCPQATPAWFRHGFGEISRENVGELYEELLEAYVKLEQHYGFVTKQKGVSREQRPTQVDDWVKDGHGRTMQLRPIGDLQSFERDWWHWWTSLQPEWHGAWRGRTTKATAVVPGVQWEKLVFPGQNGMLSVVATLYWWGCAEQARRVTASNGWQEAVMDTTWVLKCLAQEK